MSLHMYPPVYPANYYPQMHPRSHSFYPTNLRPHQQGNWLEDDFACWRARASSQRSFKCNQVCLKSFSMVLGCPLYFHSIHSRTTSGDVKMNFGRVERGRYKKYIVPIYGTVLQKCYCKSFHVLLIRWFITCST